MTNYNSEYGSEYKMIKCPFFDGNCWNTQVEKCKKYNNNSIKKQCLKF